MNLLNQLRPAETLLLLKGNNAPYGKLLKLTVADFFLRKILKLEQHVKKPDYKTKEKTYQYVVAGKRLPFYQARTFEKKLLSPYYKTRHYSIQIRTLIRMLFENAEGFRTMKNRIISEGPIQNYFRQNVFTRLSGILFYTAEGKAAAKQAEAELNELDEIFRNSKENKTAAVEALRKIGAHALLLETVDEEILDELEFLSHLDIDKENKHGHSADACGGEWRLVYANWQVMSHQDSGAGCGGGNGCSSDSGCSASGCGGSGCSGCGGGCGGCGS